MRHARERDDAASLPFDVTQTLTGDVMRVEVAGEVDMATADALAEALASALGTAGVSRVVVDLAGVTFLASSGITALVRANQLAGTLRTGFLLTGCRPGVAQVLAMTGVDRVLTITGPPVPDP